MTTAKKRKPNDRKAMALVDLGEERRERIRRFCATQEAAGRTRPKLTEAINTLIDAGLTAVSEPATI